MQQYLDTATKAEEAFYNAFRLLDLTAMRQIWADHPGAFCVHPSGQLFMGYEPILQSWSKIFQDAQRPQILCSLINETLQSKMVVHLVEERIGKFGSPKESLSVVLATNLFISTESGWRLIGHHASQAPRGGIFSGATMQMH